MKLKKRRRGITMTPKIVKKDYDRIRAHTRDSKAKVGMFRSGEGRRVKGGL